MEIIPFPNQILVEPIKDKGILGETSCAYGTVIKKGENATNVEIGQVVGFERYGLKELEINGQTLVFIHKDTDFLLCYIKL